MSFYDKIASASRRHLWVICVLILVAFAYGSDHFFIANSAKVNNQIYSPVVVEGNFDQGYYAIRAGEAYDGNLIVGDINLKENKNSPAFLPILNPLILAGLGKAAGSLDRAFILSDFIFVFIICLFVYLLAYELVAKRGSALVFTILFIFFPKFGIFPSAGALPSLRNMQELYFSRFDYPSITFMFFAAALYFIYRAINRGEKFATYLAGLFSGLLFYTYLYDWVYVFSGLFVLALIFLIQTNEEQLLRVLKIIGIGFFVSIPYWINFVKLSILSTYADIVERIGVERGRHFRIEVVWFSYIRNAVIILMLWLGGSVRKGKMKFVFMSSFLFLIFILLNIQVITGFMPHPDHWNRTQFLIVDLSIFMLWLAFYKAWVETVFRLPNWLGKVSVVTIVVFGLGFGVVNNYVVAKAEAPMFYQDANYHSAYNWLRANTPKDSIIGTLSSWVNDEIILYTDKTIFVPNGLHTIASTDEIWNRAMVMSAMFNLSPEEFRLMIQRQTLYLFADQYRNASFNSYLKTSIRNVSDEVLTTKVESYKKILDDKKSLATYQIDYVLLSGKDRELGAKDLLLKKLGQEVYNRGEIVIYKLRKMF